MSAPGEGEHAKLVCELGCEVVKTMGRIAQPMQKQHSLPIPAPVQIVKPDAVDLDESSLMWRLICPVRMCVGIRGNSLFWKSRRAHDEPRLPMDRFDDGALIILHKGDLLVCGLAKKLCL